MPVIKLWCLPRLTDPQLRQLYHDVVRAVVSVPELNLKSRDDMTVLFPPDMMKYGLGEEVIVEVTGLFARRSRTNEVRERLANHLGRAVQEHVPGAKIEVFVFPFRSEQGFWTSAKPKPTEPEEDVLKSPVEALDVTVRTLNSLKADNMLFVGSVVERMAEIETLKVPGIGYKQVKDIKAALAAKGLLP